MTRANVTPREERIEHVERYLEQYGKEVNKINTRNYVRRFMDWEDDKDVEVLRQRLYNWLHRDHADLVEDYEADDNWIASDDSCKCDAHDFGEWEEDKETETEVDWDNLTESQKDMLQGLLDNRKVEETTQTICDILDALSEDNRTEVLGNLWVKYD